MVTRRRLHRTIKVGDKIKFTGLPPNSSFIVKKIEGKYGKVVLKGTYSTKVI